MIQHPWLAQLARYLESQIPGPTARAPLFPPPAELIAGLFQRQIELNAPAAAYFVRQRARRAHVESLADVPAIPVAAFKAVELTTTLPERRIAVFHSSGTTSHLPSRHWHDSDTLAIYRLALEAWFTRRVLGDLPQCWRKVEAGRDRVPIRLISLTPSPANAPHSSLAFMIGTLMERLGEAGSCFGGVVGPEGWQLNEPALLSELHAAEAAGQPVVILGTAFNFMHLADALERVGQSFALPPGSRAMETGGYKGRSRAVSKKELHALIADRLGLEAGRIVCEYGMSELSSQAYDLDLAAASSTPVRRFQFPPWCHASVVSPETRQPVAPGQTGLLRIADLANVASVLAIETEDLAVQHADGFELLGRAAQAEARGCSLLPVEN